MALPANSPTAPNQMTWKGLAPTVVISPGLARTSACQKARHPLRLVYRTNGHNPFTCLIKPGFQALKNASYMLDFAAIYTPSS